MTSHGVKDCTLDKDQVRAWWTSWPDASIALATGKRSGVFAVDIDPRKSGFESFEAWEDERGDAAPHTLISLTGGGGRHLFFVYPQDDQPLGNRTDWLRGVDIRSDGGYVILPEASHISGGEYQWLNLDEGVPPATAPLDLLQSIRRQGAGGTTGPDLEDTSTILQGVPEGKRDDTLFRLACRLRRQLGDGARSAVELLILQAASNSDPPFPEDQARRKVEQAFRQDHSDEGGWSYETSEGDPIHHLTDLGNALRFVDVNTDAVRHATGWGWLLWTDIGWTRVSDESIGELTHAVPDMVRDEATKVDDPIVQQKISKWAMQSESVGRLSAIETLARRDSRIRADTGQFDADPHLLACRNGIVDLRDGSLRPFTRDDLVTKNTNVVYDPDALMPEWDQFMKESCQGDVELMTYMQRAAGYTLTGNTDHECFFIISGPPASGKSTFLDGLHSATGGYATTTQSDTFMYRRGVQTPKDELARMAGMRLVSVSEIRQGDGFHESLIKQLTGGDKVTARFLYQDGFEFTPQMKIWFATNHDPDARDEAMWRRLKKVSFDHVIPKEQRNPHLKTMVRDPEIGGRAILAWAVRGAVEWYGDRDLHEPTAVTMATEMYRVDQDRVMAFVNEVLVLDPNSVITARDGYNAWSAWCKQGNDFPGKMTAFRKELEHYPGISFYRQEGRGEMVIMGAHLKSINYTPNGASWS